MCAKWDAVQRDAVQGNAIIFLKLGNYSRAYQRHEVDALCCLDVQNVPAK